MGTYKRVMKDGAFHYGKLAAIGATACDDRLLSIECIRDFIKDLVQRIDMVAFGPCIAERFGEGDEVGVSAVQLIETSSITIHTNDKARDIYLDVFSCKDFDENVVVAALEEAFGAWVKQVDVVWRE